tara:strand:+ start:217 stop:543 length:327 start_codon:yes stop_codon:yes gene_type:complete
MPPQISLNTLYEMKNKKDKRKNFIFDEIIEKCHNKIKRIANEGGLNLFYEIPRVIIGKPLYKIDECKDYVITALKKNGLYVRPFTPPNQYTIYISWNPSDLNIQKRLK